MLTYLWDGKDLAFLRGKHHPKVKENYGGKQTGKLKVVRSVHFNNVSNLLKVNIMAQFHSYTSPEGTKCKFNMLFTFT